MINYIFWEITHRCNQRCRVCHLYGEQNHTQLHKELSYKQNICIIDKLYDYFDGKVPRVKISGGEPFMRSDFCDILEYFEKLDIPYGIMSNFSVISDEQIERFATMHPLFLNISLDGTAGIHDSLRKCPGACNKSLAALDKYLSAKQSDVSIELNCVMHPENLECYRFIIDTAAEFGVAATFQHVNFLSQKEEATQAEYDSKVLGIKEFKHYVNNKNVFDNRNDIDWLYDTIREIQDYAKIRKVKVKIKPEITDKQALYRYYLDEPGVILKRCLEVGNMFLIQPDGTVCACFECYSIGNLTQSNLKEIIENSRSTGLIEKLQNVDLNPVCKRCCKGQF
ncbi:MAG: radical SAM protein [Eubacterium sp.]|nr:radical SAM protein [Eubacterium sp.]